MMKYKFLIYILPLLLLMSCGDSPTDPPDTILSTGSIEISSSVETNATDGVEAGLGLVVPSQGIILDGEDLGFKPNPIVLNDIMSGPHRIETYFSLAERIVDGPSQTVEVTYKNTMSVQIVVNVGVISIRNFINIDGGEQVEPESIGVILDGDSLGFLTNPVTLHMIPEGSHDIATYVNYAGRDYVGPPRGVNVSLGETSAMNIEMVAGGVIIATARYNGQVVSELGLKLDGEISEISGSPKVITNVSSDDHVLVAWAMDDTTRLEGWDTEIEVATGETLYVQIDLQVVSPWVGMHAPDIYCSDIDGNSHSLSENWGKVIYVYYFSYT
ncbi:MAG: hypothetical protein HN757_05140 [Calditrichaeota bacterium]|nr:hypothetical protein [Calditrichota bacterium]